MKNRTTRHNGVRLAMSLVLMLIAALQHVTPSSSVYAASVLLSDDFQDGDYTTTVPWTVSTTLPASNPSNTPWSVIADPANASSRMLAQGSNTNNEAYATAGDLAWTDYSYEARAILRNNEPYPGLLARYTNDNNCICAGSIKSARPASELSKKVGGTSTVFASYPLATAANTWYALRMTVQGSTIRCSLNRNALFEVIDSSLAAGKIGFRTNWGPAGFGRWWCAPSIPAPAAPSWACGRPARDTSVRLEWDAVAGATAYQLYRSASQNGVYTGIYKGADPSSRIPG